MHRADSQAGFHRGVHLYALRWLALFITGLLMTAYNAIVLADPVTNAPELNSQTPMAKMHSKQDCLDYFSRQVPPNQAESWCAIFDGNVVFQITNQSPNIDPVDIIITLDGKRIITKSMPFASAHLQVDIARQITPGKHDLLVESEKGQAKARRTIVVKDRLYLSIAYWYYTKRDTYGPVSRHFSIKTSSHPFGMM